MLWPHYFISEGMWYLFLTLYFISYTYLLVCWLSASQARMQAPWGLRCFTGSQTPQHSHMSPGTLGSFYSTHHLPKVGHDWVLEVLFVKLPIHSEVGDCVIGGEEKQGEGRVQAQTTAHFPKVGSQPKRWPELRCLWIEARRRFGGGDEGISSKTTTIATTTITNCQTNILLLMD